MERFGGILLVAGLLFFGFSVVVMAVIPYMHFADEPVKTALEVAPSVMPEFQDLATRYPEAFSEAFPEGPTVENAAAALIEARNTYIGEGCWHCHSQFIRPVSNEDRRWGKRSNAGEYQNVLQLPQLYGTRRVGPDLIREAGKRTNDWHVAHFYNPRNVAPTSVMPPFPWLFDESGGADDVPVLNRKGFAMVTYVQWLGSWIPEGERDVE